MSKIKSCPFCGNKANIYQDMSGAYLVQCDSCGVSTLHCYCTKEDAINVWNKRSSPGGCCKDCHHWVSYDTYCTEYSQLRIGTDSCISWKMKGKH